MIDYDGLWINNHNDKACSLLKEYDAQCDYPDGSPKSAILVKSLREYSEKSGISIKELKEHWICIEKDIK